MQQVLKLAVHQLAQQRSFGQVSLPQRFDAHLFRPSLSQLWKAPKDVREFLMEKSAEECLELTLGQTPRLPARRFRRLFCTLISTLRKMSDDSLH
jgi:hypothetical protein